MQTARDALAYEALRDGPEPRVALCRSERAALREHEAQEVEDAVRADVFMEGKQHVINSALSIDGGKAWKQQLHGNPMSFEGVYKANQKLDVSACNEEAAAAHRAARA